MGEGRVPAEGSRVWGRGGSLQRVAECGGGEGGGSLQRVAVTFVTVVL